MISSMPILIAVDGREVPPVDPILHFGTSAGGLSEIVAAAPALAVVASFSGEGGVGDKVRKSGAKPTYC